VFDLDRTAGAPHDDIEDQARYRWLFEAVPDALIIVGLDGRIKLATVPRGVVDFGSAWSHAQ
jgi:PAS domain-containing protein